MKKSFLLEQFFVIEFLPKLFSYEDSDGISSYLVKEKIGSNLRKLYEFYDKNLTSKLFMIVFLQYMLYIKKMFYFRKLSLKIFVGIF